MATPETPARPPIGGRDVLVAAAYAVLVLVLAVSGLRDSGLAGSGWSGGVSIALMLIGCVSLLWRRRRPVVTLAVAGPLSIAEILGGGQISAYFLLFEALFDPVMHGGRRLARATTWIAVAVGVLAVLAALALPLPGPVVLVVILLCALMLSTPLLWGWEVRHHREGRQAAERLVGLEHELAATRAAHAAETERRTLAHDLHDVIAGHLSAVSLHTSLASTLEDPSARDRSLTTARDSAHAALRDLRSMIGVLSTEEPGTQPQVTLDWPSLVVRLRGRDPEARVHIDPAALETARVDPSVQAALLRIGAEAVTNAVHHGLAPITLDVQVADGMVTFELHNRRGSTGSPGAGVGRGAIAHRATAVGGSAGSGPSADGTWLVQAQLPALTTPSTTEETLP